MPSIEQVPGPSGEELMRKLRAPFAPHELRFFPKVIYDNRKDKRNPSDPDWTALTLFYIPKQSCRHRLDEVFGPGGWKMKVTPLFDKAAVLVTLWCKIDGEWISRVGLGGEKKMREEKDSHKSALTDAFRNACAYWGIGDYLDDMPPCYRTIIVPANGDQKKAHFDKRNPPRPPDDYLPEEYRSRKRPPQKPPETPPAQSPPPKPAPPPAAPQGTHQQPANGQELLKRLTDYEARLVQQGLCTAGELIKHVAKTGVMAGHTADISSWDAIGIGLAVETVKAYEASLRAPKPPAEPNVTERSKGWRVWFLAEYGKVKTEVELNTVSSHLDDTKRRILLPDDLKAIELAKADAARRLVKK